MNPAEDHGHDERCILRLSLDPGDAVAGSIGRVGDDEVRFEGWIELMAAINVARGSPPTEGNLER